MESIRTDELKNIFGMTISQNISLVLLVTGIGLWAYVLRGREGLFFRGAATPQAV